MSAVGHKLVTVEELLVFFPQLGSRSSIYKRVRARRLPVVRETDRSAIYFDVNEVRKALESWKTPCVLSSEVEAAGRMFGFRREDFGAAPVRPARKRKGGAA